MNKIITISAALLFASGAYAGNDNPDLYSGTSDSASFAVAVQPGVGDNYASVLFDQDKPGTKSGSLKKRGGNDDYDTILIDLGHNIDW